MELDAELRSIGLSESDATQLAVLVRQRPVGVLDASDGAPENRTTIALQTALIAARHVAKFAASLRLLLVAVERSGELSPFDEGRYWHLRALLAWRVDDRPFEATRALNQSVRSLALEAGPRARGYLARVHDTLGQILHQQGMMADALREFRQSLALRDEKDEFGRAITHGNLGRLHMELGNFKEAAEELAKDLAIVERIAYDQTGVRAQLASHLAECHLQLRVADEAEKLFAQSISLATSSNDVVAECFGNLGLGRVALTRADAPRALASVDLVFERLAQVTLDDDTAAMVRAGAYVLSADSHLEARRFDKAIEHFRAGLDALSKTASASPMEYARAYRGLSTALAAKQQHVEAARSLRLALRHLDVTGAEGTRLEVERQLEDVSRDSWLLHTAGRFLGQKDVETVLTQAGYGGFRGAKQRVAVLFSDIRGFTSLAETLEAEVLVSMLNEFLGQQTRCIDSYGGTVDKFIGDAVMAVFPLDDNGCDAVAAAVAMHAELERYNRYLPPQFQRLAMGIGIHGGPVVSGLIGSAQKREVTVIGDVVNTASRLEGLTKRLGAATIISGDALGPRDRATYLLRPLGKIAPRGRRTGVELFDVMGVRDESATSRAIDAEIARGEEALRKLTTRSFDDAARELSQLAAESAGRSRARGYELLAAKAAELHANPPADAWNGAIALSD